MLQNYGSASAAEIVSAAIKENLRGDVVGVKSFGKASLQQLIPLESDSAVLLSTAKFYSQSGKVIQGHGITPDVEVVTAAKPCRRKVTSMTKIPKTLRHHLSQRSPLLRKIFSSKRPSSC